MMCLGIVFRFKFKGLFKSLPIALLKKTKTGTLLGMSDLQPLLRPSLFLSKLPSALPMVKESSLLYSMYRHAFIEAQQPHMIPPNHKLGKPEVCYFDSRGNSYTLNEARLEARYFLSKETYWLEHTYFLPEYALGLIATDLQKFDSWIESEILNGKPRKLWSETRWQDMMIDSQESLNF